jgi:hypothetical protein
MGREGMAIALADRYFKSAILPNEVEKEDGEPGSP